MARLVTQMSFKEEVEFNDIDFEKVVGKGAFGVVSKASWRGMNVAVKMIESEEEIKAFRVEVMQLSRVDHPNIVKLYGACTTQPVCLVMEFAEGGSLYNVLHSSQPQPIYKAAHAMSWALQCAKGVDYLHSMKPKKLIHRDLKPANLLLMSGGTVLKICDFGTACDFQTYMTNNKGSAAWMAPEVFEGRTYSEKCDIFSWGVILWEVISRRKPFDDIGGPAFRIMWAVHNGRRPPLIRNIPKPLDKLMTRCWSQESTMRPSMHEVVSIMSNLMLVFKGADQPLVYPQVSEEEEGAGRGMADRLAEQTADMSISSNSGSTISDTVIHSSSSHSNGPQDPQKIEPHAAFSDSSPVHSSAKDQQKRHSVDLLDLRVDNDNSAKSAVKSHRRCNSHGRILDFPPLPTKAPVSTPPPPTLNPPFLAPSPVTPTPVLSPTTNNPPPRATTPTPMYPHQSYPTTPPMHPPHHSISVPNDLSELDHPRQRPNSYHSTSYHTPPTTLAQPHRHSSIELRQDITPLPQHPSYPPTTVLESRMGTRESTGSSTGQGRYDRSQSLEQRVSSSRMKNDDSDVSMAYSTLEPHLQPLPPNPNSRESQDIFDEHMRMAQEFLRVQTELALLHTRKKELAEALDQDWKDKQASFKLIEEYNTLQGEKESLVELHKRRRSQLDMFRLQMQRQQFRRM
ncbi:mitogen-activated protein kinase kinase kinase 7 isoform X1 [Strongylocentrotus purpuratus]|uniref:Mitogen-activated protein kinase kinase kinase 7 n=1 Tax=Strongylocentrotus purpuratus TaxID=7668 RepID=A0A7M7PHR5_STRPU|nr:mitogen-activated protein kinase kinase kinase 7 isoform X1 [Strongylocentrotus purpuratus]